MANVTLIEQLDEAIEAILANSGSNSAAGSGATIAASNESSDERSGANFVEMLAVAVKLRDLPRLEFKAQLMRDLMRQASMTKPVVKPLREGFHTITPYLIVPGAAELIDFVKQAFGAEELYRGTGSAGGIHAEVKIQDSMLMIGGGEALRHAATPTAIHLYVNDADAVYQRAVEAGATSLHQPVDQPYGDREASVKDLAGNHWYIATHKATGHAPEGLRAVTPFLHPRGAASLIDFMERALGGEEQSRYQSPDGVIRHATVKIGDSMIEMGEAHGPWQPMPATFFLYVDDVDAWYERAVAAGGISRGAPANQPYGDRVGGIADPFDNIWYLASHIGDSPM
jgi:PhnB protein